MSVDVSDKAFVDRAYRPMLLTNGEPFNDPEWWFEPKWDGMRALAYWDGVRCSIITRGGVDVTEQFPEISVTAPVPCVIDGEIVAFKSNGLPSLRLLQTGKAPAQFIGFDVLDWGRPILSEPIEHRWAYLGFVDGIVTTHRVRGHGIAMYDAIHELGMEGVVAKRSGSTYSCGKRSKDWKKIICN